MNTECSTDLCKNLVMDLKIKVTKEMYKSFDSFDRKQKWVLRELIKFTKEKYGRRPKK